MSSDGGYLHMLLLPTLALASGCIGGRTPLLDEPDAGQPVSCTAGSVTMTRARPTVMFVLDRSRSMTIAISAGSSQTRWQALGSALGAVLPQVTNAVNLGALLFPSATSGAQSCSVASKADLSPAVGNVAALTTLMNSTVPDGFTPTASAIDIAASAVLNVRAATTARALVLATDGAPDCNSALDFRTCRCANGVTGRQCGNAEQCLDDARTVNVISSYEARGLPTYVIGIQSEGDTTFSEVLNAMADAGGRPKAGGGLRYYAASSEGDLNAALTAVRDLVGVCTYLTTSVPDPKGHIVLTVDGSALTPDQWTWSNLNNGEVTLLGDACLTVAAEKAPVVVADVQCASSSLSRSPHRLD